MPSHCGAACFRENNVSYQIACFSRPNSVIKAGAIRRFPEGGFVDKRFKLWLAVTLLLILAHGLITAWFFPQPPKPVAEKPKAAAEAKPGDKPDAAKDEDPKTEDATVKADADAEKPAEDAAKPDEAVADNPVADNSKEEAAEQPEAPKVPPTWISLGSADPDSPYKMQVTLTTWAPRSNGSS